MADKPAATLTFAAALHEAFGNDPDALRTIGLIDESVLDIEVQQFSRKAARDQFSRLAEEGHVSLVTKHDNLANASVLMPLIDLARIVVQVAEGAQIRAELPALASMLEGLQRVGLPEGSVCAVHDTMHERHGLYADSSLVASTEPAARTAP